jgi:hypothetical protein
MRASIKRFASASIIGVLAFFGLRACVQASTPQPARAAEQESAAVLFARVERHMAERDKLVEELSATAKDESLRGVERERAVLLISKLGTEEGRRFMLSHLAMRVQLPRARSDEQQARHYPCRFYLTAQGYRDWNTLRTMLSMLDAEIPPEKLGWFPGVLRSLFRADGGTVMPKAMLEYELKRDPKEPRKRQLSYVLDQLGR